MFLKNKFAIYFIILFVFSLFLCTEALTQKPFISGDGHEYYLMTESFFNHLSPELTVNDISNALKRSAMFHFTIPYIHNDPISGYYKSDSGEKYSYHFFAYSLLNLPIKALLVAFNLNDLKSFQITNTILFIAMLFFLYFKSDLLLTNRILLVILSTLNPVVYYLKWTSPEVYTYVMVIMSLILFKNEKYKSSFVFMAMASWQNPPVLIFSLLVYTANCFRYFKGHQYKKIILEGLSLSLFLWPLLFYFYHFGVFNLIAAKGYSSIHNISIIKVWDLFFGLQHGIVLYSVVILCTFFYMIIRSIFRKEIHQIRLIYVISVFLMTVATTTTPNWNSGMDHVIRYGVWVYPFLLFYVLSFIGNGIKTITFMNSLFFIIIFLNAKHFTTLNFNKLSQFILSNYPSLYITEPQTFCAATHHQDGNMSLPCVFADKNLNVTKVYTDKASLKKLINDSRYSIKKQWAQDIALRFKESNKVFFLNIAKGNVIENFLFWSGSELPTMVGKSENGLMRSTSKHGFLTYGPYIQLLKGNYKFDISYISSEKNTTVVGAWDVSFTSSQRSKQLKKGNLMGTDNQQGHIIKSFTISEKDSNENIEIRNVYNGVGDLAIKSLTITRLP